MFVNENADLRKFCDELIKEEKYQSVVDILSDSILKKFNDCLLYFYKGLAYSSIHKNEEALIFLDKSIDLCPKFYRPYYNRAIVWNNLGKPENAIADYSIAIKFSPDNAGAYNNRANIFRKLMENYKALLDFNKVIELDPNNPMGYTNRGIAKMYTNMAESALSDFNKAIELAPDNIENYYNRATANDVLKKYSEAISDYKHVIKKGQDERAYLGLANCYFNLKLFRHAIQNYWEAIAINPENEKKYQYWMEVCNKKIDEEREAALNSTQENNKIVANSIGETIDEVLNLNLIQYYSCFISYSTKDRKFADKLYSDLSKNGLTCWFDKEAMKGGEKIHTQISDALSSHQKLILILSENSMKSNWVITEIKKARKINPEMLFPIGLSSFENIKSWEYLDGDTGEDIGSVIREYYIPDFSEWEEEEKYQKTLDKLLKDLKRE